MSHPIISIIVPVYNREKTIEKCIISILKQDLKDFELLLIDDGSKDNSLSVLKEFENKDKRIRVFSQKNSGPGPARNLGIKNAEGKYLMFIDSDDLIEEDFLSRYYDEIESEKVDIIIGGYKMFQKGKLIKINKTRDNLFSKYVYTFPWGKIISHKFLSKNNILFPDMKIKEDLYFCRLMYNKTQKIGMLDYNGYIYNVGETDSIVSNLSKNFYSDLIPYLNQLHSITPLTKFDKKIMDYELIKRYIVNLFYAGQFVNSKILISEYKIMKKWFKSNFKNRRFCIIKGLFKPIGDPMLYIFTTIIFMIIDFLGIFGLFSIVYCKIFYKKT